MTNEASLGASALLRLASWLSPSFPTSSYAYSHGLERLTSDGVVRDLPTFLSWARACLAEGAGRNDAILLAEAWRAEAAEDGVRLQSASELAAALQPSAERRRENLEQGAAFLRTARAAWPTPPARAALDAAAPYPVAVGAIAAAHACPLAPTLALYLHAFCGMLVLAGQKLTPLGQTDGQRAVAALNADIERVAEEAIAASLDDLGAAALRADIASMRHETQPTRLYRS